MGEGGREGEEEIPFLSSPSGDIFGPWAAAGQAPVPALPVSQAGDARCSVLGAGSRQGWRGLALALGSGDGSRQVRVFEIHQPLTPRGAVAGGTRLARDVTPPSQGSSGTPAVGGEGPGPQGDPCLNPGLRRCSASHLPRGRRVLHPRAVCSRGPLRLRARTDPSGGAQCSLPRGPCA